MYSLEIISLETRKRSRKEHKSSTSGFQLGMILSSCGHPATSWRHFWLSQLMGVTGT